jgi:hypothetical protein
MEIGARGVEHAALPVLKGDLDAMRAQMIERSSCPYDLSLWQRMLS